MGMRIVNRKEFLSQPSGTVYSQYRSHGMIDGLYEKGDTWTNDWIYQDLLDSIDASSSAERDNIIDVAEHGASFEMDYNCGSRDGTFDDDDKFLIYDKFDLNKLIAKLVTISEHS